MESGKMVYREIQKQRTQQEILELKIQLKEKELLIMDLEEHEEEPIVEEYEEELVSPTPDTYRYHAESTIKLAPVIVDVDFDGTLYLRTKKTTLYNMQTLVDLKRKIPQLKRYPTFRALADSVNLKQITVQRLCAGIELGMYDHLFKKWDKMQMSLNYDKHGQLII